MSADTPETIHKALKLDAAAVSAIVDDALLAMRTGDGECLQPARSGEVYLCRAKHRPGDFEDPCQSAAADGTAAASTGTPAGHRNW